jgi:aldose 1-epimerase
MRSRHFGTTTTGEVVEAITLKNEAGASLQFITLGGIVTSLCVPGRDGRMADVVLGFDSLPPYLGAHPYFGAIAGRVAGRIAGARFTLGGKTFQLARNDGPNHLHGGLRGLDKRIWKAAKADRCDHADSVKLTYHSPDGEEGYPGAVEFAVTYTLTGDNVFIIESEVASDCATPVSLTHHSYFNLAGEGSGDILGHELTVNAYRTFAVDENLVPLGRVAPVAGRSCDFRSARRLGEAIPNLFMNHGDLYLLAEVERSQPVPAARLVDAASGRVLTVSTNESCLQIYTGAYLDGSLTGKSGRPYPRYAGVCLECQGYSGAVDLPEFCSIVVERGHPVRRETRYVFSTE